jgi:hypothetical protein
MNPAEKREPTILSAPEYILDNFEHTDRIAVLVLNREFGATIQRITSAQKAASPEFQAWLRYKNANGSVIYVTWNRTGWFVLPFAASWFGPDRGAGNSLGGTACQATSQNGSIFRLPLVVSARAVG